MYSGVLAFKLHTSLTAAALVVWTGGCAGSSVWGQNASMRHSRGLCRPASTPVKAKAARTVRIVTCTIVCVYVVLKMFVCLFVCVKLPGMDNQMQSRVSDGRLLYLLPSPTRLMNSTRYSSRPDPAPSSCFSSREWSDARNATSQYCLKTVAQINVAFMRDM